MPPHAISVETPDYLRLARGEAARDPHVGAMVLTVVQATRLDCPLLPAVHVLRLSWIIIPLSQPRNVGLFLGRLGWTHAEGESRYL